MNLLERFPKYKPSEEFLQLMQSDVTGMRIDKEQRMMEVDISSSIIIPKQKLYLLEWQIKEAYSLNSLRINVKYPSRLFDSEYIEDLILESYRVGSVSHGFFEDYTAITHRKRRLV